MVPRRAGVDLARDRRQGSRRKSRRLKRQSQSSATALVRERWSTSALTFHAKPETSARPALRRRRRDHHRRDPSSRMAGWLPAVRLCPEFQRSCALDWRPSAQAGRRRGVSMARPRLFGFRLARAIRKYGCGGVERAPSWPRSREQRVLAGQYAAHAVVPAGFSSGHPDRPAGPGGPKNLVHVAEAKRCGRGGTATGFKTTWRRRPVMAQTTGTNPILVKTGRRRHRRELEAQ